MMMTSLALPIGLGLLGFIEPCTIGGHLLFLGRIQDELARRKALITATFIATRVLTTGIVGALTAFIGQALIGAQTMVWLIFGVLYLVLGLMFLSGHSRLLRRSLKMTPVSWRLARNPVILGITFGLNIPACAAPIIFGLLALTATTETVLTGFVLMALFGFALSAPLVVMAVVPGLSVWLERIGHRLVATGWLLGLIFLGLGIWSIWFGLFVDPANWRGQ
jgi:cytochrome c-type biogenesis protein